MKETFAAYDYMIHEFPFSRPIAPGMVYNILDNFSLPVLMKETFKRDEFSFLHHTIYVHTFFAFHNHFKLLFLVSQYS